MTPEIRPLRPLHRMRPPARQSGMALVITLSMVVLLTFVIVAFFSSATNSRKVQNSSAGGVSARLLAEGSLGAVQAELLEEIRVGSNSTTANGTTVYTPKTPADMVPAVATLTTGNDFRNVIKQSGRPFYTGAKIFSFPGTDSTAAVDSQGRSVNPIRWAAPMLTGAQFAAGNAPQWIYISRNGTYSAAPTAETIGRVAFNVYDVGGLLNANASGFAPGDGGAAFSSEMHRKGSTVWADLREIPGIVPGAFAATSAWPPRWRLTGDWGSGTNGFSHFTAGANASGTYYERTGWRTAYLNPGGSASDRMFASRQDLIRYAKANPGTFAPPSGNLLPALQYLTHWSRWNNTPSFRHDETRTHTRPVVGNVAAGGNDYSGAVARAAANPFFPAVTVTIPFQRKTILADGTLADRSATGGMAKIGEPLVKYRFPLTRLGLVNRTTTSVPKSLNNPIYYAFGLTRGNGVSDPWVYDQLKPVTDRIYTLEEVAAQGREPNFFELLKAAIHAGSLGKASGAGSAVDRDAIDGNLDLQVLRLGTNLIDQFDADSFPTILRLPPGTGWDDTNYLGSGTMKVKIYGIENLPQVQGVTQVWKWTSNRRSAQSPPKDPSESTPVGGTIIMQPVLWNPHDITTYADPGSGAPTKFRVWGSASSLQYHGNPDSTSNPNRANSTVEFTVELNANPAPFREPNLIARRSRDGIGATPVLPAPTPAPTPPAPPPTPPWQERTLLASIFDDPSVAFPSGIEWLGTGRTQPAGGVSVPGALTVYAANSANGMSVYLDYQDTDGAWVTYSALESISHNGFVNGYTGYASYFAKPDPRSQRFGSFASQTGATNPGLNGVGAWNHIGGGWPPSSGQMASLWDVPPRGPVSVAWGQFSGRGSSGTATNPTGITMNTAGAAFRYTDPDGVLRWGDSGFGANGMVSNQTATRPIVLNRGFRSVGEMGYAFRDLPWKSIDFFSERSGDSALLDVFCISESPDDAIVANRVSLNSASNEVVRAMLKEGLRRDAGGAGTSVAVDLLSSSELATLVTAVRTTRTSAPFLNRSELVSRVMAALPFTGDSFTIKRQREAVIRALADMVETNNWNFMVDIVAQSGRIRQGASPSAATFVAAGESRRWQFLSLQRTSASVVEVSDELVSE